MLLLEGRVQHYEWGGFAFIPALLGRKGKARKPHAEYWLGSHPNAPAIARGESGRVPLIEIAPDLPYLLKVLDAREMLSIQAHPSQALARRGFAAENAAGIPISAPTRNYKDANHKPEVHVALTPFWMLNGFRPWPQIVNILEGVPEFRPLRSARTLKALVRRILTLPEPARMLRPLLARLRSESAPSRKDPAFWVLRAAQIFPDAAQDRGLFFLYLLNLVVLQPGEGTYQPAGVLHAYLEGSTVELMANSDNVLRAGLTSKHVDTGELLRAISYAAEAPPILKGESAGRGIRVYRTPSTEFELTRIHLSPSAARRRVALGPVILLLTEGEARIGGIPLHRGQAVFARDEAYSIEAGPSKVEIFEASVPAP
ncbi:MAG: mannose-6-phosphate isomerase, class I [Bryobacterales bacterium]|nr:mannose-6-phosphate isomerase, class I [Bryobacterales bacterium]